MLNIKSIGTLIIAASITANTAYATDTATKTYKLTDLKRVVANHENCKPIYTALQKLADDTITLHFTKGAEQSSFTIGDGNGKTTNHTYKILKQEIKNNTVNRVGAGSFEIANKKIEYIIEIAADLNKKDFKYAYPMILSGENAHCFYTALLNPSADTVKSFQKNIQSGLAEKGSDLTGN